MEKTYISERVILQAIKPEDSTIIALWKNQKLIREMSVGLETEITEINQRKDIQSSLDSNQPYFLIIKKEGNNPIGYVRINWMDMSSKFAWLRFGLGEDRGNGYAKDALKLFIKILFDNGVHRIDAEVYCFNEISYNLMLKLGFKHEGTKREAHQSQEKYFDVYVMGILKEDFIV